MEINFLLKKSDLYFFTELSKKSEKGKYPKSSVKDEIGCSNNLPYQEIYFQKYLLEF